MVENKTRQIQKSLKMVTELETALLEVYLKYQELKLDNFMPATDFSILDSS